MGQRILLAFLLSTLFIIGVAHILALHFTLYFSYPWLDIPMHALGGISIAFAVLLAPYSSLRFPKQYTELIPVLMIVLIVGLLWEFYEILIGIPYFVTGFEIDMAGDLVMDLIGGTIGYYIGRNMEAA